MQYPFDGSEIQKLKGQGLDISQLSNEKTGCLGYIGEYTAQLYDDYLVVSPTHDASEMIICSQTQE